jgi:hypothetical protein
MSEQGEEGQTPGAPESEAAGSLPPRPTVRESLRRGLFVRLPTEGESGEGLPGSEQPAEAYGDPAQAGQYGEVPAEEYEGWRQLPDGSWEQLNAEGYDPTPVEPYPEIDAGANFASVAGGEPFFQPETGEENAWSFAGGQEAAITPEAEIVEYEQVAVEELPAAEVVGESEPAAVEQAYGQTYEEVASEAEVEPEPATVERAYEEVAPEAEVEPEPATVEQAYRQAYEEVAPEAEVEPIVERGQARPPLADDPVATTGLYIPADVELLEGDMLVYGENEKVPPMFEGSGLGEPLFIGFGDLPQMLVGLRRLLPTGTRLTYNYDYERAWVRSSAEVDLPSFAERVRTLV